MNDVKGYCRPDFIEIQNIFSDSITSGHETGASIAIEHKGEMIVDLYGGYKNAAKDIALEKDTLLNVFSELILMMSSNVICEYDNVGIKRSITNLFIMVSV